METKLADEAKLKPPTLISIGGVVKLREKLARFEQTRQGEAGSGMS